MKDALAAPVNGLPLDDTARASQLDAAGVTTAAGAPDLAGAAGAAVCAWALRENRAAANRAKDVFIMVILLGIFVMSLGLRAINGSDSQQLTVFPVEVVLIACGLRRVKLGRASLRAWTRRCAPARRGA
jgi:hypothetical protein